MRDGRHDQQRGEHTEREGGEHGGGARAESECDCQQGPAHDRRRPPRAGPEGDVGLIPPAPWQTGMPEMPPASRLARPSGAPGARG